MDCTCHVPRKESSPTSGIVFSAGVKPEAPAPPVSWCVALLAGSAVCCDSQSWKPAAGRNLQQADCAVSRLTKMLTVQPCSISVRAVAETWAGAEHAATRGVPSCLRAAAAAVACCARHAPAGRGESGGQAPDTGGRRLPGYSAERSDGCQPQDASDRHPAQEAHLSSHLVGQSSRFRSASCWQMARHLRWSESLLYRARRLIERADTASSLINAALREKNAQIAAMRDSKSRGAGAEAQARLVEHVLLRKILSVDRGDVGKLLRGLRSLVENVVALSLSLRAAGANAEKGEVAAAPAAPMSGGSRGDGDGGGDSQGCEATSLPGRAHAVLAVVDGQLDIAEGRLQKVERRASQLQLIGGLSAAGSDEEGEEATTLRQDQEQRALATLVAAPRPGMAPAQLQTLVNIVAEMRTIESSIEFHTALLAAHRSVAAHADGDVGGALVKDSSPVTGRQQQLRYSRTNFSYGSTPHASWLQVMEQCTPLRMAIEQMRLRRAGSHDEYCVFGSSLGWLCFYGSLTFGLRTTGYELVGPLVSLATRLADRHGVAHKVTFRHADMLVADLSRVRVLVLTSHVWDKALLEKLDVKLAAEALPGTLVIDYGPRLAATQPHAFEKLTTITLPTSWDSSQPFCVFRRRKSGGGTVGVDVGGDVGSSALEGSDAKWVLWGVHRSCALAAVASIGFACASTVFGKNTPSSSQRTDW
jgi:hypothetical protein